MVSPLFTVPSFCSRSANANQGRRLLQEIAGWIDVDCIPATGILAEPATGAAFLIHRGDAEEIRYGVRGFQAQRLKWADIDA